MIRIANTGRAQCSYGQHGGGRLVQGEGNSRNLLRPTGKPRPSLETRWRAKSARGEASARAGAEVQQDLRPGVWQCVRAPECPGACYQVWVCSTCVR